MSDRVEALFARGRELAAKQFHYAALEVWAELTRLLDPTPGQLAELSDETGKTLFQLSRRREALGFFARSETSATDPVMRATARMHLGTTLAALSEYDRAQRVLTQLADEADALPTVRKAQLFGNLAFVQAHNQFHAEALQSTLRSRGYFEEAGVVDYEADLCTNLGLHYMELGRAEEAEACLTRAVTERADFLSPLSELSRLYLSRGDYAQSLLYADRALGLVWSSIMSYEKEEIARLCQTLANLAFLLDQRRIALRLIEKAQLYFGRLSMWREWEQAQNVMDTWTAGSGVVGGTGGASGVRGTSGDHALTLTRFISLLDALDAQELLDHRFAALLDTRVHYAAAMADLVELPETEKRDLILACRFCDYGLAALEPEAFEDPHRSDSAWKQYTRHPEWSAFMLDSLDVQGTVPGIVLDHHERVDGTGFPSGKCGQDLELPTRLLSVADTYAGRVVMQDQRHSEALAALLEEGGQALDRDAARQFTSLFGSAS